MIRSNVDPRLHEDGAAAAATVAELLRAAGDAPAVVLVLRRQAIVIGATRGGTIVERAAIAILETTLQAAARGLGFLLRGAGESGENVVSSRTGGKSDR